LVQKNKSKNSYEYVVWKDINDNKESIDALVKFCKYVPCKVNLIEYNPMMVNFSRPLKMLLMPTKALESNGIVVKVDESWKDIDAACGQLANTSINS
jgi:23S rRNA (adenine2503-C2)-methyltransferase